MKQLLCFISILVSLEAYAQVSDTTVQRAPASAAPFILEHYCGETVMYTPDILGINRYQPKLDLHSKFDSQLPVNYSPTAFSSYEFPAFRYTKSGLAYGTSNVNMYNPHGARTASEAVVFGTINYFLSKLQQE